MNRDLFDESHDLFRKSVRTFVEREVAPQFQRWEDQGIVDRSLYEAAGDLGILGLGAPVTHGGGGVNDYRFNAIVAEEFCRPGCINAGLGIINQIDVCLPYFRDLGTPDQQARWLPGMCSGELVAGVAMTEPAAGSDLAGIKTAVVRKGGDFVLNGAKHFISSAMTGDLFMVVARTGDEVAGHGNLTLVIVEADMTGFARGRNLAKAGQHAADTGELFFDDVLIPQEHVLGEVGRGFYHLVERLPQERLSIAATAVAHSEAAFAWTLNYCKERHAFGQPIGTFQANRFTLATLSTELDIARVFVDRQIAALAAGDLSSEDAAASKWWCTELNKRVLDACVQLHGGYGYMDEYPISRAWRDGRAFAIYGGTNEIMKDIIGRRSLGL